MPAKEGSLQPAWDAEPDQAAVLPPSNSFAESGLANLKGLARFTIACLILWIAFRLVGLLGIEFIERLEAAPGGLLGIGLNLSGMAGLLTLGLGLPLAICVIVGFLIWLIGAANNAEAIDQVDLRISPGWQAAFYFVPFFHLVVPVLGMHEIVSHSRVRHPHSAFLVILLWWSSWILGTFGIYLARTLVIPPPEIPYPLYLTILDVTAAVLTSCAAVFLIILIRTVTKSQAAYAEDYLRAEAEDPFESSEL